MIPSESEQMAIGIGRRQFISGLGAAPVLPLAAHAQQPTMPVIGFLSSGSQRTFAHQVDAFRQSLKEVGYVEGQNVAIEYRWADGQYDRLSAMADELVRRRVAVLFASGGTVAARAAKVATTDVNADTDFNTLVGRDVPIALRHSTLCLDRASGGINGTGEFDQYSVAGAFDDAPVVRGDRRLQEFPAVSIEPGERPFLVRAH
jgi:hypothetical protein